MVWTLCPQSGQTCDPRGMVLRLDPQLAVVWRTPTSIQFGVTRPSVVLHDLDLPSEKMIAALGSGVSRSGLHMIGRAAGATEVQVDALLARLRPVMLRERPPALAPVVIAGSGLLADRLAGLLAGAGVPVLLARTTAAAEAAQAGFAIAIGHYVLDPALHGLWLRRDVPHLPVILGDSSAAIGPLVVPGRTACLLCLQRHTTDADPAWPAIASQLWGRRSPAETELVASEVAAIVARMVVSGSAPSDQVVIDAATGEQSRQAFDVHPECGCLALPARKPELSQEPTGLAPLLPRP